MFHYYMFNKPFGCVTARRDTLYPTVMDYFSELHNDHLNPVGRLDRETTGLLLITDDGNWNQQLTHPAYHKKKTYLFTVLGDLTEDRRQFLENGILLKGSPVPTSPAKITLFKKDTLANILDTLHPEVQNAVRTNLPSHPVTYGEITISEGRKRQIRRMMKAVHCCVIELKRISIDDIHLDESLAPGNLKKILLFKRFHGLSKLFVCYSHKERSGNEIALLCFPDLLILLFFCSFLLYSFLIFYSFLLYSFLSFLFFPTLFSLHFRFSIPGSGCFFICSFSLPYNWVIRYSL